MHDEEDPTEGNCRARTHDDVLFDAYQICKGIKVCMREIKRVGDIILAIVVKKASLKR